jgi:hypothetical protein
MSNFKIITIITGMTGLCEPWPSSGFLNNLIFTVWGCQPHAQPPIWRTRVSLFVWLLPLDVSGLGGPTSCCATASVALRVSGALKPHHHDKVGIASVGVTLSLFVCLLPLDLSGLGPTSSCTTASVALRVSGALKPHHHDKVGVTLKCIPQNWVMILHNPSGLSWLVVMMKLNCKKLSFNNRQALWNRSWYSHPCYPAYNETYPPPHSTATLKHLYLS